MANLGALSLCWLVAFSEKLGRMKGFIVKKLNKIDFSTALSVFLRGFYGKMGIHKTEKF